MGLGLGYLGGGTLGSDGQVFTSATGGGVIAKFEQNVVHNEPASSLAAFEQVIQIAGGGVIAQFEQTIHLRGTGGGIVAQFEQNVSVQGGGTVAAFEQTIIDAFNLQLQSLGWDLVLSIGGVQIPANRIMGDLSVTRHEGDASLMNVTLKPLPGVQDITFYQGKSVTLDVATAADGVHRIYSGKVDIPEIDLVNERYILQCTNTRKELNNSLSRTFVEGVGWYSEAVFSESEDQDEELQKRLETVEASLDYDGYNTPHLTDWEPKAAPDYVLGDSDIYRRTPDVKVTSRGRIVNRIDVELGFNYQRLRHRERNFSFDSDLSACLYDAWGLPPTVEMLRGAVDSSGWYLRPDSLETVGLDPSGVYRCFGVDVIWSTKSGNVSVQIKKDDDGNVVTDSFGNPQYEITSRTQTDIQNVYANSATWKAAKRWSQNISERITVSVQSPQSIAQYGEVIKRNSFGVESTYEESKFADIEAYESIPEEFTQTANGDWVYDADNEGTAYRDWRDMVQTAVRRAVVEIRKTHRDNTVTLQLPLRPEFDLRHTIEITATKLRCKGKIKSLQHSFNIKDRFASTEIVVALSRAAGSPPADGSLVVVRPAITDPAVTPGTIRFGTHDIPLNGEQDLEWNGYIFKVLADPSTLAPIGFKNPVSLIIDTPDIEDESRDTREVNAFPTEQIGIRNDLLEVEFASG